MLWSTGDRRKGSTRRSPRSVFNMAALVVLLPTFRPLTVSSGFSSSSPKWTF
ncbi:Uncharacterised protein [Mycobacteroides abscessus subsp. abscessus]|nr:Uncharacterised protein [Mycobacteroides abscessus subsp. abscessus]